MLRWEKQRLIGGVEERCLGRCPCMESNVNVRNIDYISLVYTLQGIWVSAYIDFTEYTTTVLITCNLISTFIDNYQLTHRYYKYRDVGNLFHLLSTTISFLPTSKKYSRKQSVRVKTTQLLPTEMNTFSH